MARTRQSEFHKEINGNAHKTLASLMHRAAIENAVQVFAGDDGKDWEALCAIRDHVHALLGAYRDLDFNYRQSVLARTSSGEFKGKAQAAINLLNSNPDDSLTAIYAEIERQGIPEY